MIPEFVLIIQIALNFVIEGNRTRINANCADERGYNFKEIRENPPNPRPSVFYFLFLKYFLINKFYAFRIYF